MFKNLKISTKIVAVLLFVAIAAVGMTAFIIFQAGKKTLEQESFRKLTAVREMKADQIEDYFRFLRDQVITFSEDRMVVNALIGFRDAFNKLDEDLDVTSSDLNGFEDILRGYYSDVFIPLLSMNMYEDAIISNFWPGSENALLLQYLYIASNESETGSKHELDDADDGSEYSAVHRTFHPVFRSYLERFGYYDIFLIDYQTGNIVYSVFKEVDFGTSLLTGPYRHSNFAAAFNAAREAEAQDFVRLVDFESYSPSYGAQAAFVSSPIFDGEEMIGVLIFQLPIDRINDIMTSKQDWSGVGLGRSGETYIVGRDNLLRNQSRFLIEDSENYFRMIEEIGLPADTIRMIRDHNSTVGIQPVRTAGTLAALSGETGTRLFPDYRDVSVLSSFRPLSIQDVDWVIMSEIDEAEAFESITGLRNRLLLLLSVLLIAIIVLALLFSRTLTRPLNILTSQARELAQGDMDVAVEIDRTDEIGQLANSFDSMRNSIKNLIGKLEEINITEREKAQEALSDQLAFNEALVDTIPNPLFVKDTDTRYITFNRAYEEAFGIKREDYVGRKVFEQDYIPEEERSEFQTEDEILLQSGGMKRRELSIPFADGRIHSVLYWVKLFELSGGEKGGLLGVLVDISELKRLKLELQKANVRMKDELDIGREIQTSMFPLTLPAFPDSDELEVYAQLIPAQDVGEDFYDFYFIDDNRFCFYVGDVSGKGVPSPLFMAVTKTLIKSRAIDDPSPSSILTHVNDEMSKDNKSCMFVTVFLAFVNVKTGEMIFTNAGHNQPYIKRAEGNIERIDEFHGPVIGAMPGTTYGEGKISIGNGDTVFIYTDGVTESMNPAEELYTKKRLEDHLSTRDFESVEDIIHSTLDSVKKHQGKREQSDDITLLAVKLLGEVRKEEAQRVELTVHNRLEDIESVQNAFTAFSREYGIDIDTNRKMAIVFDELLSNIISYAYIDDETHNIDVIAELVGDRLTVTITDDGIPFNPLKSESPDTRISLEEREIDGLGIHLVRNIMDKVFYQRITNRNEVTLRKYLTNSSKSD